MQIEHSEFQDQLVRGLAHRMNNILTLFHGYLGLLLDNKDLDQPTLDGLAKIKEGACAASELVDRTHSLARPHSLVWREVDLGAFLRMLKPSFLTHLGPRTTLDLDVADDLPPVWADASRVKTAVFEIVRNALEATFAHRGRVKIVLRAVPAPAGTKAATTPHWVSLTVNDNGPGIPEHVGEKIFQPFFSTKKRKHNSGLGLTVALAFMQQLGGVLHFQSEPGNTEFQLLLPSRGEVG